MDIGGNLMNTGGLLNSIIIEAIQEMSTLNAQTNAPATSVEDTTNSVNNDSSTQILERGKIHIPYILNGELYEIQSQEGENVTVKCCNCPPDRVYRGSVRSTGNFHMHIKRRHPDLLSKLHEMKVSALLERRDRFIRNRKLARRRNNINKSARIGLKFGNRSQTTTAQAPNGTLFTHKLKIKAAFQRHQLQHQQQQEQEHDWNQGDDIAVTRSASEPDIVNEPQPLNYSANLRSSREVDVNLDIKHKETIEPPVGAVDLRKQDLGTAAENNNHGFYRTTKQLETPNVILEKQQTQRSSVCASNSNQSLYDRGTMSTTVTPSVSNNSDDTTSHLSPSPSYPALNYKKFCAIKNESSSQEGPIDLSSRGSTETFGSSGFDSANDANLTSNNNSDTTETATSGSDQILQNLEGTLLHIQRQLDIFNRLYHHRLRLEIAKFEHLHSDFKFNY